MTRDRRRDIPRAIRYPTALLAAAIVGPAIIGMLLFVAVVLAPFGIVVLPFLLAAFMGREPEPKAEWRGRPGLERRRPPPKPQPYFGQRLPAG